MSAASTHYVLSLSVASPPPTKNVSTVCPSSLDVSSAVVKS